MPASRQACSSSLPISHSYGWLETRSGPPLPWNSLDAALVVLGLAEIRQDGVVVPALAAALAPFVVVGVVAAHVDHAVDRTGAAQHLAARLIHHAVVQVGFRLAVEHPVDPRIARMSRVAERNVDPGVAVLAAGLQQQYAVAAGFRQPCGEHASRRPGAGNDIVVGLLDCWHGSPVRLPNRVPRWAARSRGGQGTVVKLGLEQPNAIEHDMPQAGQVTRYDRQRGALHLYALCR